MSLAERLASVKAIGDARKRRNMDATLRDLATAHSVVKSYRRKHSHEGSLWGFIMGMREGLKAREK